MKARLWLFLFCCSLLSFDLQAQGFTTNGEYLKQRRNYPFIEPARVDTSHVVQVIRDITYSTATGRALKADFFCPKSGARLTEAVVLIHGGGWRSGSKQMDHPMASALAKRGIVAVCVEYRMSDEALYPAAVQDIKCAVRWLKSVATDYGVDSSRISLLGTSAGGQLAALVGSVNGEFDKYQTSEHATYSDRVRSVIDIDGVLAFIHPDSGEGRDKAGNPSAASRWFGKSKEEGESIWIEASPLSHVNRQSAAFLFVNSAQTRFHAGQQDMINALNRFGIQNQVESFPNTPHTFWLFNPWFEPLMQKVINYITNQSI